MRKIIKHDLVTKIDPKAKRGSACEQVFSVSFLHLTKNGSYHFDYINDQDANKKAAIYANLMEKLRSLCALDWQKMILERKKTGLEKIDYSRLRFKACDIDLPGDETVYILRFKTIPGQNGRIIGIKEGCLSHSAYYRV